MSDGYARLWAGVVSQAIADMDSRYLSERAAAKRWVYSGESRPGSFLWVCDHLDLDPNKLQTMCMTRDGRKKLIRKNGPRHPRPEEGKQYDQADNESI